MEASKATTFTAQKLPFIFQMSLQDTSDGPTVLIELTHHSTKQKYTLDITQQYFAKIQELAKSYETPLELYNQIQEIFEDIIIDDSGLIKFDLLIGKTKKRTIKLQTQKKTHQSQKNEQSYEMKQQFNAFRIEVLHQLQNLRIGQQANIQQKAQLTGLNTMNDIIKQQKQQIECLKQELFEVKSSLARKQSQNSQLGEAVSVLSSEMKELRLSNQAFKQQLIQIRSIVQLNKRQYMQRGHMLPSFPPFMVPPGSLSYMNSIPPPIPPIGHLLAKRENKEDQQSIQNKPKYIPKRQGQFPGLQEQAKYVAKQTSDNNESQNFTENKSKYMPKKLPDKEEQVKYVPKRVIMSSVHPNKDHNNQFTVTKLNHNRFRLQRKNKNGKAWDAFITTFRIMANKVTVIKMSISQSQNNQIMLGLCSRKLFNQTNIWKYKQTVALDLRTSSLWYNGQLKKQDNTRIESKVVIEMEVDMIDRFITYRYSNGSHIRTVNNLNEQLCKEQMYFHISMCKNEDLVDIIID